MLIQIVTGVLSALVVAGLVAQLFTLTCLGGTIVRNKLRARPKARVAAEPAPRPIARRRRRDYRIALRLARAAVGQLCPTERATPRSL
jgi:hypothetical protein